MSRIAELGESIFDVQRALGLSNPSNWNSGLTETQLVQERLLQDILVPSELHDLFAWRNGVLADPSIPMAELWFAPGFYMLSSNDIVETQRCLSSDPDRWRFSWHPIFTSGSADFWFYDTVSTKNAKYPIFYFYSESKTQFGMIYDNIEAMFGAVLECYKRGAYHVDAQGFLDTDCKLEAEISRFWNPTADYWRRLDLF